MSDKQEFQIDEYRLDYRFDDLAVSAAGVTVFFSGSAVMAIGQERGEPAVIRIDNLYLDTYMIDGSDTCIDIVDGGSSGTVSRAMGLIERHALKQFKREYSDGLIPDGNWC